MTQPASAQSSGPLAHSANAQRDLEGVSNDIRSTEGNREGVLLRHSGVIHHSLQRADISMRPGASCAQVFQSRRQCVEHVDNKSTRCYVKPLRPKLWGVASALLDVQSRMFKSKSPARFVEIGYRGGQ
eukprot:scaffold287260_cov21-Tisochrysis_lutea.AAC.1